jgi:hypothetical protein
VKAFEEVGLSLPVDGSRDKEIKIRDLPGLEVGDWESWTPTGGIAQPSDEQPTTIALPDLEIPTKTATLDAWLDKVMSNKTLKEVEEERPLPDLPEEDEYV